MDTYEVNASFEGAQSVREAELKLIALRASGIMTGRDGHSLTATLDEAVVDRAVQVIRESGGTAGIHSLS
ncbi:hypothetical protein [Paenibacillus tarimensis]|uniref:hypothetical protein n=1 Tax=Paenibacillus tarimensis TaxID=416012 RepID=UPI001F1F55EA|nr:hypothetical protein [Paenibacillus tarimensis]MCF2942038.1 hypothetical protein [Paenibacillus tarimensis]